MTKNTGDKQYSINKTDIYKIISENGVLFLFYYLLFLVFSLLFIITIRFQQYLFHGKKENLIEEKLIQFFKSITLNSPLGIMSILEKNDFIGLSPVSYFIIFSCYAIAFLIILEGYIRTFLFSVVVGIIMLNKDNNPYKNSNMLSKVSESVSKIVSANYTKIYFLTLVFFVPFVIPYLLKFLKMDNYDVKKNFWLSYLIFFLVISPLVFIFISRASLSSKLRVLDGSFKFVEPIDVPFIEHVESVFDSRYTLLCFFLFILLVFCYTHIVYIMMQPTRSKQFLYGFGVFAVLFLFVPFLLLIFTLSVLFSSLPRKETSKDMYEQIKEEGVSTIYELLIKYNYPCFPKTPISQVIKKKIVSEENES